MKGYEDGSRKSRMWKQGGAVKRRGKSLWGPFDYEMRVEMACSPGDLLKLRF